ncbi:hypothetical protein Tco_0838777 [Tanacetum coccineum]|uniref:Uncharacterized protein n=1 Tax=Tanacetum coccineum TaxID=301880 RepID=A0ABQ5ANR9_9ASTR
MSGESSSGQVFQEEQALSTSGNQEQDDDFDFWTDSYASDDDEISTKQVSQDIIEEVSANPLMKLSLEDVRMTKVIKGEFEKIKDIKVEDVSLTCDTPVEAFNNEVNRLSRMDDDLFTYEVEVANISCDSKIDDDSEHEVDDDMGYDSSDIRGDDEVELTDEESSDDMDEVAEVFRIDTSLFDFEIPMCKAFKEFNYLLQIDPDLLTKDIEGFKTYEDYKDDWIYEWNKDVPWVDEKPWTNAGV